ncbi:hypothetical protein [Thermocatellispora tengchongensis]|uniref:hypothetical protein n=1 Tax=Thermocatellispora tengchongensis TaxID=1073253 RepID=UPI0036355595
MLLVVDYAETRTGLAALLQQVAADTGRRVRVLLLARSAGEWWQRLGGESAAQDLAEGPCRAGPGRGLRGGASPHQRRHLPEAITKSS